MFSAPSISILEGDIFSSFFAFFVALEVLLDGHLVGKNWLFLTVSSRHPSFFEEFQSALKVRQDSPLFLLLLIFFFNEIINNHKEAISS